MDNKGNKAFAPRRSRLRPHEPKPKAHEEPTTGIPANIEGRELGAYGEERVAAEDRAQGSGPGNLDEEVLTDEPHQHRNVMNGRKLELWGRPKGCTWSERP